MSLRGATQAGHGGEVHASADQPSDGCSEEDDAPDGPASGHQVPTWSELVSDHYSIQQACYFTEVEHVPGAVYASSQDTDDFIWNHAYLVGPSLPGNIRAARAWLAERSRELTIYVDEAPGSFGDSLADLRVVDRETWMVRLAANYLPPKYATFLLCSSASQRAQFGGLVGVIFRPDYETCLTRDWSQGGDGHCKSAHLLLHIDGQAVGTGSLYWRDHVLGAIHDVGVLASHRRQGLGSHIVQALLALAYHEGITTCYLQCEASMEKFYTELGFTPQHRRLGLQPMGGVV